jgi:hypothetical protein
VFFNFLQNLYLHLTNTNLTLENFNKKAGKTIKAMSTYSDSTPVHSMSKSHCKIFLQRRGVELSKKDCFGLGPFTNATVKVLQDAVLKHKNDAVVSPETTSTGTDDDDDDDIDEGVDDAAGEAVPSVDCPASSVESSTGEVNEIKVKQVLSWLLNAPTDTEVLVRLRWLSDRYPTMKSYCTYLRYFL